LEALVTVRLVEDICSLADYLIVGNSNVTVVKLIPRSSHTILPLASQQHRPNHRKTHRHKHEHIQHNRNAAWL